MTRIGGLSPHSENAAALIAMAGWIRADREAIAAQALVTLDTGHQGASERMLLLGNMVLEQFAR